METRAAFSPLTVPLPFTVRRLSLAPLLPVRQVFHPPEGSRRSVPNWTNEARLIMTVLFALPNWIDGPPSHESDRMRWALLQF